MTVSLYSFTAPVLARNLDNFRAILDKAAAHFEARKVDPAVIVQYRLFPDMLPFSKQVQICTDISKGCMARLSGTEAPKYEDNETTFAELAARLEKTAAYVRSFKAEQVDGAADKPVVIKTPRGDLNFTGLTYVQGFVLPNVYFHAATGYNILRHNGVEVGKMDFLGRP